MEVERLLSYADLFNMNIVGSRTSLGRWIKEGNFPSPLRLRGRNLRWTQAQIEGYLQGAVYPTPLVAGNDKEETHD